VEYKQETLPLEKTCPVKTGRERKLYRAYQL